MSSQYAPAVFDRFTELARQVVVLAQEEARALKHNYIGTEHILLGLLREEEGLAARVLESLDITMEKVRAQVAWIVGQGAEVTTGQIPFTPRAKKVLELALREALSLGHNYIGTEHILLGLVRENEGVAARILLDFDANAEKLRGEIIRMLEGPSRPQTGEGFPPGAKSKVELVLRRVVPVAQQMFDGTWVVSVEVWDHELVIRWARSQQWPPAHLYHRSWHGWHVSDDAETSYTQVGASGGGNPERGYRGGAAFKPSPPPTATSLRITHETLDDAVSVSLTD
jgi:Clp amino terminal domain, pathogenicity island component